MLALHSARVKSWLLVGAAERAVNSTGFGRFTVLGQLFIEKCPSCGGAAAAGFCAGCSGDFEIVAHACEGCGLAQPVTECPRRRSPWLVDRVVAPFAYGAPLDLYVRALKYHGARELGRALGRLVLDRHRALGGVDALVPVPLHRKRLRERGYNQAVEIARTLGRELRVPLVLRGVRRVRAGPPQIGQSAVERRASMIAAFTVSRDFGGARLAIVDDVITTGATVNSLAAALLRAGAQAVEAWAVARTL